MGNNVSTKSEESLDIDRVKKASFVSSQRSQMNESDEDLNQFAGTLQKSNSLEEEIEVRKDFVENFDLKKNLTSTFSDRKAGKESKEGKDGKQVPLFGTEEFSRDKEINILGAIIKNCIS